MNFKKKMAAILASAACAVSSLSFSGMMLFDGTVNAVELSGLSAFQITKQMNVGWNLGNTMDATTAISDPTPTQTETAWGNPVTTQALIDAVKAKGFNTVRIPTTWYQHVDGDFNIDADYLARVKEIVDYCYNADMYVILNVHHEQWINRSDFDTAYDDMSKKLTKLWSQIAAYFKDYDQHLVFEGMNEPRAAGTTREWWGATNTDKDIINKLDADFVKTVRGVDSKYNSTRLLMIPSYCASSDPSIYGSLEIPNDDHIAVSVHAYSPYSFVMDKTAEHDTFTSGYKAELNSILKNVRNKFISNKIPVVIGEMSSSNYNNTQARIEWATEYAKLAKSYGMPIVLWDNNAESNPSDPSEAHGYLNRRNLTWYDGSSEVADTLIKTYNSDSIAFASDAIAPGYTHQDINSGTQLGSTYSLDTSTEVNFSDNFDFSFSTYAGKEFAVAFNGETPKAAMMDGNWKNWTDLDPYEVKNGIAYFSVDELKNKWSASSQPEHICFGIYSGTTTITKIAVIDAPQVSEGGALVIEDPVIQPSTDQPATEQPSTEQPSTEQPSTEEPSTEQPSTEQPSTEQPSTDPYTEPPTPTGEVPATELPEPSLVGDVDINGEVGLSDITALSKFLVNTKSYPLRSDVALANADVNHDKLVNAMDNTKLIEFNLRKIFVL